MVEQSFRFLKTIEKSNATLYEKITNTRIIDEATQFDKIIIENNTDTNKNIEKLEHIFEKSEDDESEYLDWNIEMLDEKPIIEYACDDNSIFEPIYTDENKNTKDNGKIKYSESIQQIKLDENSYRCPVCDKMCGDSLEAAVKHVTLHSLTQNEDIQCENCNLTFKDKTGFNEHSCEVLMYNCPKCHLPFSDENDMRQHVHIAHSHQNLVTFLCKYCDQKFATEVKCKMHENKMHSNGPSIVCPNCPKKFYYNSGLKRHLQSHTGEKLFGCDLCNKRFPSQAEVNRHRKYHTNERQHKCTICDKRFIESGHLLNHVNLVHLDNKKFECEFCDKKFITNFKLKRHQKSRTCEMVSLLKKNNTTTIAHTTEAPGSDQKVDSTTNEPDETVSSTDNEWKLINLPDGTSGITNGVNGRTMQVIGIQNENNEIQDYLLLDADLNQEDDSQQMLGTVDSAAETLTHDHDEPPFISTDQDFMNWDQEIL